jgi:Fe-S cluster assembly ATP-binding protein
MSLLEVRSLEGGIGGRTILHGIDLEVSGGEVHAIMGPNGSGKSTFVNLLIGRPSYIVSGGEVLLDGEDLISLAPWQRARRGLLAVPQYPAEIPGVSLLDVLKAAGRGELDASALQAEAAVLGLAPSLLERSLNVEFSGGEKKRIEVLALLLLGPKVAILDEVDSGLDVDALRQVASRLAQASQSGLGVVAVTHYSRLLRYLKPDRVHVLVGGRIVETGGPELAESLEQTGYAPYGIEEKAG